VRISYRWCSLRSNHRLIAEIPFGIILGGLVWYVEGNALGNNFARFLKAPRGRP
jgi:hypothetical protein